MRFLAIIPFIFSTAALIIAFLCIFAGSKPGFMEEYQIISLNTSRVGQNIVSSATSGSGIVSGIINGLGLSDDLSALTSSIAHRVGIEDFYSVYVLDYCEGSYTPRSTANATVKFSDIKQNVTRCSGKGTGVNFTPGQAIQRTLDRTGTGLTLKDINWDEGIDDAVKTVRVLLEVMLAFYCIAIGFAFFTMIASLVTLITSSGRKLPAFSSILAFLAFLALGIASGLVTAIGVKADHIIDDKGAALGISANRSNKLLALTWAGTALLFLATLVDCFGICTSRKRRIPNEKSMNYS